MISPGVFLNFLKRCNNNITRYNILINSSWFSSSSINANQKFWSVYHFFPMCDFIYYIYIYILVALNKQFLNFKLFVGFLVQASKS